MGKKLVHLWTGEMKKQGESIRSVRAETYCRQWIFLKGTTDNFNKVTCLKCLQGIIRTYIAESHSLRDEVEALKSDAASKATD